jgi:PAS domain S-box-containing protein
MDMRTVFISYLAVTAICVVLVGFLWWQNRRQFSGLGFWLASYFMQFVGLFLIVGRDVLPDYLSVVVGNTMFISGAILFYMGLERFLGTRSNPLPNYLLLAFFVGVHAYFLFVYPSLMARLVNLSLVWMVLSVECIWLVFRRADANLRIVARPALLVFTGYGMISIVRTLGNLGMPSNEDLFHLGLFDTFMILALQMLFIALTFSLFMMVNMHLAMNWREDMDNRKRVETKLRESEEKFYKAFHSNPDLVAITRLSDGKFVEVSDGLLRATGYAREDVLDSLVSTLQIWENPQNRDEFIRTLQSEGSIRAAEYQYCTKSGEVRIGLLSAEIIQLRNEPHIVSVIHDITELRRFEAALRASEASKRLLIENVRDIFVRYDLNLRYQYISPSIQRFMDLPPESFIGKTHREVGFPEDRAEFFDASLRAVIQSKEPLEVEFSQQGRGGEYILQTRIYPELNEQGEVVSVVTVTSDITERKNAEEALKESREQYRFLLDNTSDFIARFDRNGIMKFGTAASLHFHGYDLAEIINTSAFERIHPEDLDKAREKLKRVIEIGNEEQVEYRLKRKSGGYIWVEAVGRRVFNSLGEPEVIVVQRNITGRREAEEKLQQAQARIVEQQRSVAAFEERERLARELHDGMGQTLSYISLQAQSAQELIRQGHIDDVLHTLVRLAETAQEAHGDLRGYIKTLKNEVPTAPEGFFSALENYCQHLRQTYLFDVSLTLPTPLPEPLANAQIETHLTYIIREALSNARRYSGENQATVEINVDDETVQAVIEDKGIGMDPHYTRAERRVHERFGIRIMRERVNEVGGTLFIDSEPGKGTRVIARMPRTLSTNVLDQLRVVIVDDHPLFVNGLQNLLATRGVRVIGLAHDGLEAQELVPALKPDLVLMDINMPRMNGLEATRLLKAKMPLLKIVILTTFASEANIFEALRVGASGYLLKGMSAGELFLTLTDVARGESEFSAEMAQRILAEFAPNVDSNQSTESEPATDTGLLTKRHMQVLRLVAHGLTYKEIGERLFLSERTVKYHMGEILARLHLKGRRDAELYAKNRGIE